MGLSRRIWKYFRKRLPFQLDLRQETPHRIAMGAAIGIFIAIVPSVGIGPFVSFLLAMILNGNKLIAIALTFLSNPFTFVPIAYPSFLIGTRLLGQDQLQFPWVMKTVPNEPLSELLRRYLAFSKDIFYPMFVGSVVLGLISGVISYFLILYIVKLYRSGTTQDRPDHQT